MFALLANGVLWSLLSWWLFPGALPYVIGFVVIMAVIFIIMGIGFWETNSSGSSTDFTLKIGDDTYSGKIEKDK